MLWKCHTQYASKIGKLSTGHRTGKGQFSSQPQRKAMPKIFKLPHNCTHLTRLQSNTQNSPSQASTVCESWTSTCSTWFWKRQRNQRSNWQHPLDHREGKRVPENTSISALLITPKPLTVSITRNWKILKELGIWDHLTCLLRNLYAGQETTVRTGHGTTGWF